MKHILLAFYLFVLPFGGAIATSLPLAIETPQEAPVKPIKVSEIIANLFSASYDFFQKTGSDIFEGFVSLKDFVEMGEWLGISLKVPETRHQVASFSVRLLIALFVSFILAQALSSWLKPKIHTFLACKKKTSFEKSMDLLSAIGLSTIAPLFFGFSLYTLSRLINPEDSLSLEIARILSSGAATIWILLNIARLFLKPPTPNHQHIPLSRKVLATTYRWIRRMALVALFSFFVLETGALISLPLSGERLLLQGTGFVIAGMAVLMMLALRQEVKEWVRKEQQTPHLSLSKKALLPYLNYSYVPLIVFIVISYVSWSTHAYDSLQTIVWKILLTLSLLPFVRILAVCLRKIRVLYINKHLPHVSPFFGERVVFYGRQIDSVTFILLNLGALLFVLNLWGLNLSSFTFGRALVEKAFSIVTIIAVALFITRAGNGILTKYLNTTKKSANDAKKQKRARFKTIYSISRNVLRIAVWTPATLLIIIEMGIDIVPLLATLGILSFGLSFGVQSLVKDLTTGFFMLLEDAFAVGDLVVINGQMGRIESLTVRVVRLRATDGSLYTFPYGNITSLSNQNRDFSAVLLFFKVGFEADINQVFSIIEKISKDLRKDPATRKLVTGPVEIDGINEISDHALEIRIVLKTKPSEHHKVKWAFNRLLKQYLEAENIPVATPRQVAYNYAVEN